MKKIHHICSLVNSGQKCPRNHHWPDDFICFLLWKIKSTCLQYWSIFRRWGAFYIWTEALNQNWLIFFKFQLTFCTNMCSGFHTRRKNHVEKLKLHSKSEIFVKLFETEEHSYVFILQFCGPRWLKIRADENLNMYFFNPLLLCFQHPYPSEEQKKQLAQDTGLTILQVNNWLVCSIHFHIFLNVLTSLV